MHNGTADAECFSWAVVVGVLDDIVCDGREPVFGKNYNLGEPRVEELRLSCSSCNDDVQGGICGRVGWNISDSPDFLHS